MKTALNFAEPFPFLSLARANPGSYVVGTDLSKIQPEPEVPNCHFEKDDCEETWLWDPTFDYIHIRQIVTGIRDPKRHFQQVYDHLVPGGWIEIQDGTMELDGVGVEGEGAEVGTGLQDT